MIQTFTQLPGHSYLSTIATTQFLDLLLQLNARFLNFKILINQRRPTLK